MHYETFSKTSIPDLKLQNNMWPYIEDSQTTAVVHHMTRQTNFHDKEAENQLLKSVP